MTTFLIYGASDDLVEIEGSDGSSEEYDAYERPITLRLVSPSGESVKVMAEFGQEGWEVNVLGRPDERPNWPVTIGDRPDYEDDPAIEIECPVGTVFELVESDN